MNINTGKAPISLMTLLAILSLSLIVNLPGLAVTPMLSKLASIFPGTSETEQQMLTLIPNLLIIPFVLLSGKLSLTKHKIATILCANILFVGAGVAYLFARTMGQLIVISCVLGCGAGLVIPFAAGLIADCFAGRERMKVMGLKSGTSNISLVIATFIVGWLSSGNWHLPFLVYLIGIVPLVLTFQLKGIPKQDLENPVVPADIKSKTTAGEAKPNKPVSDSNGFYVGKMLQLIGVYAFITFSAMLVSYYIPYLIQSKHLSSTLTGTVTSLFYLFMFIPGFGLSKIVGYVKGFTFLLGGIFMLGGMALLAFIYEPWTMCIGSSLVGLGYGICQPLIYDKTSRAVSDPRKATLALAIVLAANYIAIAIAPFIVDGIRDIFHAQKDFAFPFILSFVLLSAYLVFSLLKRNTFAFSINKAFYDA